MRRPPLGRMLYSEYNRLHAERGCSVDSWEDIGEEEQQFWQSFAEAIDYEPNDLTLYRFGC